MNCGWVRGLIGLGRWVAKAALRRAADLTSRGVEVVCPCDYAFCTRAGLGLASSAVTLWGEGCFGPARIRYKQPCALGCCLAFQVRPALETLVTTNPKQPRRARTSGVES